CWLIASLLFLCAPSWSAGQESGSISGQVFDTSNGRPLSGATVMILDSDVPGTQTDATGRFEFRGVPPGEYRLRVSAPRYGSAVVEKVKLEVGKESTVRANITPNADPNIEVVEVVADITESSEATQLL